MKTYRCVLPAMIALVLGTMAPPIFADEDDDDDCEQVFDVDWFIEINATDGDAGGQLLLDGKQWTKLEMERPNGKELLKVKTKRSLKKQGITEFFFETAEPSFDDQSLAEFLALFPEGEYEFEGETVDDEEICATAEFTHNLPGAPETDAYLNDAGNLVIIWEEADGSFDHPDAPDRDIEVESYEVIAEIVDGDVDFRMVLPADAREVTLPPEFGEESGDEVKFEVICKEESGNQTIAEETLVLF